jgi:hypothetical protein
MDTASPTQFWTNADASSVLLQQSTSAWESPVERESFFHSPSGDYESDLVIQSRSSASRAAAMHRRVSSGVLNAAELAVTFALEDGNEERGEGNDDEEMERFDQLYQDALCRLAEVCDDSVLACEATVEPLQHISKLYDEEIPHVDGSSDSSHMDQWSLGSEGDTSTDKSQRKLNVVSLRGFENPLFIAVLYVSESMRMLSLATSEIFQVETSSRNHT